MHSSQLQAHTEQYIGTADVMIFITGNCGSIHTTIGGCDAGWAADLGSACDLNIKNRKNTNHWTNDLLEDSHVS